MEDSKKLETLAKEGLERIKKQPGLIEGQVFVSNNRRSVGRLVYTTHLPSSGLEELKSDEDLGLSVEVWFKKAGKKLIGLGHEAQDLSLKGVEAALDKALTDAVEDPDFTGFLKKAELSKSSAPASDFCDQRLLDLSATQEAQFLAQAAWEMIRGAGSALTSFTRQKRLTLPKAAFILNGDVFLIREKMALASTNGLAESESSAILLSFLTAMLEKEKAKGSSWQAIAQAKEFSPYRLGRQAILAAIKQQGGTVQASGRYPVVFGPQAVAEIFGSLLLSHLRLSLVDFGASFFNGRFGQKVASELLTLYDDPRLKNGAASKKVTCEGYPTQKTRLIEKGILTGFLSDSRTTNKILRRSTEETFKIGADPRRIQPALAPANGFRFAAGGGRLASTTPQAQATNLVIKSSQPSPPAEILRRIKNGLFIGRLWYTYPVGGYASGIISGTAVADNFIIKNGRLDKPILPNSLRLEDNLRRMIENIVAVGNNPVPTILWASDEITHAPWVAIDDVNLVAIKDA